MSSCIDFNVVDSPLFSFQNLFMFETESLYLHKVKYISSTEAIQEI